MKFQEYTNERSRGISITRENERTFSVHISMSYSQSVKGMRCEAIAFLYAQALLSGCGTYSRAEFLDAINLLGASISISVSNQVVTISFSSLDTHQAKLQSLVQTMLQSPSFAQSEITRIKELKTNELLESKEDAKLQSIEALENALFTENDYRYNFNSDELITEITHVDKKQLQQFHAETLRTPWTFTFVASTKNAKKTADFIATTQKLCTKTNTVDVDTHAHTEPYVLCKKGVSLVSIPSKQNIEINIGASLPFTQDESDYYAFVFGLNVLGKWGGFAGRLMSTVREKEGLTYGIYAKTETTSRISAGYWRIMTFFAPDKVMRGIASTLREIELIKTKGITQTEFDRFKTILETGEIMRGDSLQSTLQYHHGLQTSGFDLEGIENRKKRMHSLTRSEINAALKKYLDTSKLVIACAGPTASKAKELNALK